MIRWVCKTWRAYQRRLDMKLLWPVCKEYAKYPEDAKTAFFLHIHNDPAWTTDYTDAELVDLVNKLP